MAPISKPLETLGKTFLKEYRRAAGLSQERAAAELKITRPLLSQIENAKSPYSQRHLEQAAKLYGCTPAEILDRPPNYVPDIDLDLLYKTIVVFEESCIRNGRVTKATPEQKAEAIVTLYRLVASGDKVIPNDDEVDDHLKQVWEDTDDGG